MLVKSSAEPANRGEQKVPMDTTERQVIDDLFRKLRQVEEQTGPRDPEAEAHIRALTVRQPAAPYYMAQTIVMQEQALAVAQARLQDMESELKARPAGGGFLAGLFGGGATPDRRSHDVVGDPRVAAYAKPERGRQMGGTGFLAGAMQTAVGVAGGMMLGSALGSMFASDEAAAAEADLEDTSEPADLDTGDSDPGLFEDF
jgi:hypothetical protein